MNSEIESLEDGSNSSNETQFISYPVNGSFKESLYMVALERSYGLCGFVSPVIFHCSGNDCDFDFYHPATGRLIRVFETFKPEEIEAYAALDSDLLLIIDRAAIRGALVVCDDEREPVFFPDQRTASVLREHKVAIYYDHFLWECRECSIAGNKTFGWRMLSLFRFDEDSLNFLDDDWEEESVDDVEERGVRSADSVTNEDVEERE